MEQTKEPLTESWFYILLCLYNGPNHGYGIMRQTSKITGGRVNIGAGTMYGACTSLVKRGYIKESMATEAESRKKNYELTRKGLNRLLEERKRLQLLVADAETIMDADDGGMGGQDD